MPYEKSGRNEPVCIADEVPFDIPQSWEWVRFGMISTYSYTKKKINAQNADPKMWGLDLEDIEKGGRLLDQKTVGERKAVGDKTIFDSGDILYSKLRPYLLKILVAPDCGICTPEIVPFKVFGNIVPDYIVAFLKCPYVNTVINSVTYGVKMPRVGTKTMTELLVPIPPLSEQKRIIKKLCEVEPLADNYTEAYVQVAKLNQEFPELLKKSILQEAIQGKLVSQDPNDEPASILLDRIRLEKQRLIREGKIKKDKHESIIFRRDNSHYEKLGGIERCIDDETPFEIPANWEWARLGSIAIVQSSKRVFEKDYVDKGIPFFRSKEIGDLYRGEEIHTQLFITREHYERLKKDYGVPKSGDILITSVGTIGNSWICDGREFYYKDGNITQICSNSYLFSQYIQLFINSPLFIEQAQSTVSGTAYNALTIVKLKNMLIPVPPLLEQRRIVEKQRELFDKITLI